MKPQTARNQPSRMKKLVHFLCRLPIHRRNIAKFLFTCHPDLLNGFEIFHQCLSPCRPDTLNIIQNLQVQKGTLTITGGTFACEPYGAPYYYNFLLNCVDSAYKDGTAKIIVKGGTFVNFDPSNNSAEGAGTNFVADGYTVTSEVKGNDTYYTVVAK